MISALMLIAKTKKKKKLKIIIIFGIIDTSDMCNYKINSAVKFYMH